MTSEQADYNQCSLTQRQFQQCDSKVIDLVYGYAKNADVYIPNEVALLFLAYYYVDEHFTIAHSTYDVMELKNGIELARMGDYGSAFGNVLIESELGGIYNWQFKIICVKIREDASIGISTEYTGTDEIFEDNKDGHNYGLSESGDFYYNGSVVSRIYSGHGFESDDVLTMTLDLNKKTLKYKCEYSYIVYEDEGLDDIACGPDIRYKMAVSLSRIDEKIELIDFWTRWNKASDNTT